MDFKKVFSIFIALVMIGSIVGFTVFYSFPDQSQGSASNGPQNGDLTAIDFQTEDVEASVFQLLPSMRIFAETELSDVVEINNSIYSIEGVKRVNGKFQQAQTSSTYLRTGFVYVAEISFDKDINNSVIVEKLKSETELQYVDGFSYALVTLPTTISMQSVEEALELTKEYTFSEEITEALVGLETIEGDNILIHVQASFVGNDPINIVAFETKNLTATPKRKTVLIEAPIAELEPRLFSSGYITFSQLASFADLNKAVSETEGVLDVYVAFPNVFPDLFIESESNATEQQFSDFNAFLHTLDNVSVSISNNPLRGSIEFLHTSASPLWVGETETTFVEFAENKAAIEAKLTELGIDATLNENTDVLYIEAELESEDTSSVAERFEQIFSEYDIELVSRQPGKIELEEIIDPDTGNAYPLETGTIDAMFLLGHTVGETVSIDLEFAIRRGEIYSAFASEAEE